MQIDRRADRQTSRQTDKQNRARQTKKETTMAHSEKDTKTLRLDTKRNRGCLLLPFACTVLSALWVPSDETQRETLRLFVAAFACVALSALSMLFPRSFLSSQTSLGRRHVTLQRQLLHVTSGEGATSTAMTSATSSQTYALDFDG